VTIRVDHELADRVRRYYLKYCPDKMASPAFLPTMLGLYRGRETELLNLLSEKYGAEPGVREAYGPTGFARDYPHIVPLRKPVLQVACGRRHGLALTEDGAVMAWGLPCAALGLGQAQQEAPRTAAQMQVVALPGRERRAARIASGADHALAVSLGGALFSWGSGASGELGHGDRVAAYAPKQVVALEGFEVVRAAAGLCHSAVVTTCGKAFAFGFAASGALGCVEPEDGDADAAFVTVPKQVILSDEGAVLRATDVFCACTSTVFTAREVFS
jgi:alpha-tubulin suppressor-like RCC1 family protein